jgi:hypothetical protein
MQHGWRVAALAAVLIGTCALSLSAADPGVTFIGHGFVSGHLLDRSGLTGKPICRADDPDTCIDQATLGGFGSGLTFTGHDDVFLGVPDRGPFDGRTDVPYLDRFHLFYMKVNVGAPFPNIATVLLDTRFMKNEFGQNLVGDSSAFSNDARHTLRFDPEGVRVSKDGNFFVSDEYGPYIDKFDRQGHLAINDHEFLVLERDNRSKRPTPPNGVQTPNLKILYKIDLNQAELTDVSGIESLPELPEDLGSIKPLDKKKFLNLLDADYKVDTTQTIKDVIAEKIGALAWGPDLSDGRHVLYVLSDNDLFPDLPTQIYAFAIDAAAGVTYQPQQIPGPLFPPGQVKKIVK